MIDYTKSSGIIIDKASPRKKRRQHERGRYNNPRCQACNYPIDKREVRAQVTVRGEMYVRWVHWWCIPAMQKVMDVKVIEDLRTP